MALNPRGSNNVGTITQRFIKVSSLRSRALAWYVTEWYPQVNDEKWFLIFRVDRERTVPGIKSVSPRSSSGTPKRTLSIHRAFSRLHAFSSLCTACLRKWDRWVSPPPPSITTIIARFSPSILLLTSPFDLMPRPFSALRRLEITYERSSNILIPNTFYVRVHRNILIIKSFPKIPYAPSFLTRLRYTQDKNANIEYYQPKELQRNWIKQYSMETRKPSMFFRNIAIFQGNSKASRKGPICSIRFTTRRRLFHHCYYNFTGAWWNFFASNYRGWVSQQIISFRPIAGPS